MKKNDAQIVRDALDRRLAALGPSAARRARIRERIAEEEPAMKKKLTASLAAALIAALFDAQLWLQIVWFLVISFVTLYFTRPLVKKYVNSRSQPTNADMMIGKEALVTEDIDNVEATGAVSVGGKVWTARSADGGRIKSGAVVSVLHIEGVKLIVEPVPAQSQA